MKIAFHSNQLGMGGTEVALWDYSTNCREMLGHECIIVSKTNGDHHPDIIKKFADKFSKVYLYDGTNDGLLRLLLDTKTEIFYEHKDGRFTGLMLPKSIKHCVHVVFPILEWHGDVYAYVSEWLSQTMSGGTLKWVSYMVTPLPRGTGDLREELGIPKDAVVFGSYGSKTQFNIEFVKQAVIESAGQNRYFIFKNFNRFTEDTKYIRFLPGSLDVIEKAKFVATCDAMLYARLRGETFGVSTSEFASLNKPIIAYEFSMERAIVYLWESTILYKDLNHLKSILLNFKPFESVFINNYTPEIVMKQFNDVFIRG